ncbi:MAG: cyclic nucleotide-binding domain-containing protein, partial [Dissulfurispiraceae bacterium]
MDWLEKINFRSIPLFEGLSDLDLVRLVPNFEFMEFRRDETLCRQGDAGDAAFIVVEGKVSVSVSDSAGESRELAIIGPLEMVGEMSLLTGDPRSATVSALTNVKVLRLRKERFDDLIRKHISFLHHLNRLLSKKIWNRNFADSENAFPRPGESLPAAAVRGQ